MKKWLLLLPWTVQIVNFPCPADPDLAKPKDCGDSFYGVQYNSKDIVSPCYDRDSCQDFVDAMNQSHAARKPVAGTYDDQKEEKETPIRKAVPGL